MAYQACITTRQNLAIFFIFVFKVRESLSLSHRTLDPLRPATGAKHAEHNTVRDFFYFQNKKISPIEHVKRPRGNSR
jgi:hypothetical protein